jgi:hypothetical protein
MLLRLLVLHLHSKGFMEVMADARKLRRSFASDIDQCWSYDVIFEGSNDE